jgi:hypothetical protein
MLHDLAAEVLDLILAAIPDARSLAHVERASQRLRERVAAGDDLWRRPGLI